ncbi:MAG TPA: TnsA endonuclease N-terminal domain-containing protein [Pyrinomonadaceae bacterium]|nr:TnsA endonuclease N-terminal domain-containing protein [Pyrinomonadaceae bacterium]
MAKRRRENGEKTQKRRAREGRGVGRGADYTPELLIHDVPSQGLSSRIWGWTTGRVHHVFSIGERRVFYIHDWREDVRDIREQYPLNQQETLAIADQLGVRHPRDPRTKEYIVMTSDFVFTISKGQVTDEVIRAVKLKKDLENARVKEKLEIERIYWEEVRGLDWAVITEDDIDRTMADNVEWVHCHRYVRALYPLTVADVDHIEAILTPYVVEGKSRLRDLTNECDANLSLEPGSALSVVRYLIANRRWEVDMSKRIMPPLPLALTITPALFKAVPK